MSYCEEITGQQHLLTRRFYDCYRFQEMASKFENALQEPHGIAQQGNEVWQMNCHAISSVQLCSVHRVRTVLKSP